MLSELRAGQKVIGSKQVKKAIIKGIARRVYIAEDAESHIIGPLVDLCRQYEVEVIRVENMRILGDACGIEVGSAAAALLNH